MNGPLFTEDEAIAIMEATGRRPANVAPGTAGMDNPERIARLRAHLETRRRPDASLSSKEGEHG